MLFTHFHCSVVEHVVAKWYLFVVPIGRKVPSLLFVFVLFSVCALSEEEDREFNKLNFFVDSCAFFWHSSAWKSFILGNTKYICSISHKCWWFSKKSLLPERIFMAFWCIAMTLMDTKHQFPVETLDSFSNQIGEVSTVWEWHHYIPLETFFTSLFVHIHGKTRMQLISSNIQWIPNRQKVISIHSHYPK